MAAVDDLAAEVGKTTAIKKVGQNKYLAACPLHEDKHPSLSVFEGRDGKARWNCFAGCGSGDIADWLMRTEGKSYREAVAALGGDRSVQPNPQRAAERERAYWRGQALSEFRDKNIDSSLPDWAINTEERERQLAAGRAPASARRKI